MLLKKSFSKMLLPKRDKDWFYSVDSLSKTLVRFRPLDGMLKNGDLDKCSSTILDTSFELKYRNLWEIFPGQVMTMSLLRMT